MRLLLLHHTPTPSLARIADAVLAGARDEEITGVEVVVRDPLEATAADLLAAHGYLLGTAAHFGYMSGALKHLFDQTFLQIGGSLAELAAEAPSTAGRPFGLWVHGRYDVTGAVSSVLAITGALGWRQSAPVLELLGDVLTPGPGAVEAAGLGEAGPGDAGSGDTGTGELLPGVQESAYDLGATLAALTADLRL